MEGTLSWPNNTDTMRIDMIVYDAKCSDAGLFFCNASYINTTGDMVSEFAYQNVTGVGKLSNCCVITYRWSYVLNSN